jgi:hypothetical protein
MWAVAALIMFPRAILILSLLALPACNWQPYSRSTSGVSALDKKILYDFRDTSSPLPKLDAATQRRVLTVISPNYYERPAQCPSSKDSADRVVLNISGLATGSFTSPGAKEDAYLVDVTKCGENPAFRGNRLLVFTGDQLTAAADTKYSEILKSYDLNGDGVNELLLAGGFTHMGEVITEATLVRFDKRALVTVENFGSVYHDVCGLFVGLSDDARKDLISKSIEPIAEAVVISYLPRPGGQMPSFVAERYRAPCPAGENQKPANWQRAEERIKN